MADHLQRVSAPTRAQVPGVVQRVDEEQVEDAQAPQKARARLTHVLSCAFNCIICCFDEKQMFKIAFKNIIDQS